MKFNNWLRKEGLTHQEFVTFAQSRNLNISKGAVSKWCNGQRIPRKVEMIQIHKVTDGEVTPNDFYL